jgi:hypothetical protein
MGDLSSKGLKVVSVHAKGVKDRIFTNLVFVFFIPFSSLYQTLYIYTTPPCS